jgi:NAD(P)-dependent dehydrogenase (short-subunit alcohol dehydrogenase family)
MQGPKGRIAMTDRIALITGAAQGIGLACAEALAEDGCRVVLVDIKESVAAEAERLGGHGYVCDMGVPDEIAALFDRVEAEVGPISVLVNNAGIAIGADFLEMTEDQFRKVLDINLVGVFLATQRAAKSMVASGITGAIVNMSSINAQVAIPQIAGYCASKGGVMQLTKVASLALAPHGIRVNAVGPGSIDTEMMAAVNADPAAFDRAMSRTPLKRPGTAREVGDVVAFLASDKASYVTGETIYVDGGRLGLNYTV